MKVTFKKTSNNEFEWFQDLRKIVVRIPLKGTSLKKVDVYVSDLLLKINVLEKNIVKVIDLKLEVDYQSKESSTVYIDENLEVQLIKKEAKLWEDLMEGNLSKEEKLARRQASMKRREEEEQKFYKTKQDLKIQHDRFSTQEQMRVEEVERKTLEQLKKQEKSQAEADLYNSLDSEARFTHVPKGKEENSQAAITELAEESPEEVIKKQRNNDIFTDEDFGVTTQTRNKESKEDELNKPKEKTVVLPEIRAKASVQIPFTEKVYPHLAAREQHYKDPPMPKIKQTGGKSEKEAEGFEQKNPLWIKDKGDEFFRNKDFYSALNAYNSAFKLDNTQIMCLHNRAACHLYLYNYRECLYDCETIIKFINQLPEAANKKLLLRSTLRKSVCLSWSGLVNEALAEVSEVKALIGANSDNEQEIALVEGILSRRAESIKIKKLGDLEFRKAQYDKAESYYLRALQEDPENEIVFGNLALIYTKQGLFQKAIENCDKQIGKIRTLIKYANFNPIVQQSNSDCKVILVKCLVRKATALKELNLFKEAVEVVREALLPDENSKAAKDLLKELEIKVNDEQV